MIADARAGLRLKKAARLIDRGDGRLALHELDGAVGEWPELAEEPGLWRLRGLAHLADGELRAAHDAVSRGLEVDPWDRPLATTLVSVLAESGELAEAELLIRRLLRESPGNPHYVCVYARLLSRGGEYEAARAAESLALQMAPGDLDALRTRLLVAYAGMEADAEGFARELLRIDPTDVSALSVYSAELYERAQFVDALEAAEAAARERPHDRAVTNWTRHLRRHARRRSSF